MRVSKTMQCNFLLWVLLVDPFEPIVSSCRYQFLVPRKCCKKEMTVQTKKAVNTLAYSADVTSTSFQSLGIGMSYVSATAHQAGFSLSETASAMGVLSNNGLEADKAWVKLAA